jgi:hypothetical protein
MAPHPPSCPALTGPQIRPQAGLLRRRLAVGRQWFIRLAFVAFQDGLGPDRSILAALRHGKRCA